MPIRNKAMDSKQMDCTILFNAAITGYIIHPLAEWLADKETGLPYSLGWHPGSTHHSGIAFSLVSQPQVLLLAVPHLNHAIFEATCLPVPKACPSLLPQSQSGFGCYHNPLQCRLRLPQLGQAVLSIMTSSPPCSVQLPLDLLSEGSL